MLEWSMRNVNSRWRIKVVALQKNIIELYCCIPIASVAITIVISSTANIKIRLFIK